MNEYSKQHFLGISITNIFSWQKKTLILIYIFLYSRFVPGIFKILFEILRFFKNFQKFEIFHSGHEKKKKTFFAMFLEEVPNNAKCCVWWACWRSRRSAVIYIYILYTSIHTFIYIFVWSIMSILYVTCSGF